MNIAYLYTRRGLQVMWGVNVLFLCAICYFLWLTVFATSLPVERVVSKAPAASLEAEAYIKLKGTVVNPDLPVAFVEIKKSSKQQAVYVGDIVEGFQVTAIRAGLVQLSRNGREVKPLRVAAVDVKKMREVGAATSALPGPEPERKVSKSDIQQLVKEPTSLLRDVGFTPKIDAEGKIVGMKIVRIATTSIFAKRGIRVGDVVTNINGKDTTGIGAAMALLGDLDTAEKFVIKVLRRGEPKTFTFTVE
jgi:type II secretion system protein C